MPFKQSVAAFLCSAAAAGSAAPHVVWQADTPIRTVEKTVLAPYASLLFPEEMRRAEDGWTLEDARRLFP